MILIFYSPSVSKFRNTGSIEAGYNISLKRHINNISYIFINWNVLLVLVLKGMVGFILS